MTREDMPKMSLYGELLVTFKRCGFSPLVADDLAERAATVATKWYGSLACSCFLDDCFGEDCDYCAAANPDLPCPTVDSHR